MEAAVYEKLSQQLLPEELDLHEVFDGVSDPFDGLKTVYMQEKFYSDYFVCIVSIFTVKCMLVRIIC